MTKELSVGKALEKLQRTRWECRRSKEPRLPAKQSGFNPGAPLGEGDVRVGGSTEPAKAAALRRTARG